MLAKRFLAQGWDVLTRSNCWPSPILGAGGRGHLFFYAIF